MFELAVASVSKAMQSNPSDPEAYLVMAEYQAALAGARKGDSESAVRDGLINVNKAIEMRNKWGEAYAIRALLYIEGAHNTKDEATRSENNKNASESFNRAFELNPLLRKKYASYAAQIESSH